MAGNYFKGYPDNKAITDPQTDCTSIPAATTAVRHYGWRFNGKHGVKDTNKNIYEGFGAPGSDFDSILVGDEYNDLTNGNSYIGIGSAFGATATSVHKINS